MTNETAPKLSQRQTELLAYFASRGLGKYATPCSKTGRVQLYIPGWAGGTYLSIRSAAKDCDFVLARAPHVAA